MVESNMSFTGRPHECRHVRMAVVEVPPQAQSFRVDGYRSSNTVAGGNVWGTIAEHLTETRARGVLGEDNGKDQRRTVLDIFTEKTVAGPGRLGRPNGRTAKSRVFAAFTPEERKARRELRRSTAKATAYEARRTRRNARLAVAAENKRKKQVQKDAAKAEKQAKKARS